MPSRDMPVSRSVDKVHLRAVILLVGVYVQLRQGRERLRIFGSHSRSAARESDNNVYW